MKKKGLAFLALALLAAWQASALSVSCGYFEGDKSPANASAAGIVNPYSFTLTKTTSNPRPSQTLAVTAAPAGWKTTDWLVNYNNNSWNKSDFTSKGVSDNSFTYTWADADDGATFRNIAVRFDPITVTLRFDTNGGTPYSEPSPYLHANNEFGPFLSTNVVSMPKYSGTRAGYSFEGWTNEYVTAFGKGAPGTNTFDPVAKFGLRNADTNVWLYATWSAKSYTVAFDANGGSVNPESKSVTYDSTYGGLPTPAWAGHEFKGWFTAASGGTEVTSATKVTATSNHTLYAHWDANSYSLTMAVEGGGSVSPSAGTHSYSHDTQVTLVATPNVGWLFRDWLEDGLAETSRTVTVTGPATYTAVFTQEIFTVMFDANGGSVDTPSTNLTYDSTYGTLPTPTWTGHNFDGWYTALPPEGVKETGSTHVTSNHTLYAHWTAKACTLTFDLNGNGGSDKPADATATYGSAMPALSSLPKRTGYTFEGFYDVASGGTQYYAADGTGARLWDKDTEARATLYAHWTAKEYAFTVDPNGGTFKESTEPSLLSPNLIFGSRNWNALNAATRTGYTLTGFWTAASGGVQVWDASRKAVKGDYWTESKDNLGTWKHDAPDGTFTAYAQWSANVYTVTLDANGGEFGQGAATTRVNATYDSPMPALTSGQIPTRTGYEFRGFRDAKSSGTPYYRATGTSLRNWDKAANATLYAQWTPITYSIAFNGGAGASGEMATIAGVAYGQSVTLPTNAFSKPGCAFQHWKQGALEYADGATVSNLTTTAGATVTLVAAWDGPFWIKFDANGGSGTMDVQRFEQGEPQALSENLFTRAGYGFSGWATNEVAAAALKVTYTNRQVVVDIAEVGSTNTIFAVWATNTYWVAFDANGGTGDAMAPQRFVYDQVQNLSSNTYSNGVLWRFGGWSNTVDGVVYADGASVSNLCAEANATNTLIAVWADDRTDLSRAMHCTNMQWYGMVMPPLDKGSNMWTIREGEGFGYEGSGSCVEQAGPAGNALVSSVVTNGTLTFWCRNTDESEARLFMATNGKTDSFFDGEPDEPVATLDANSGWQKLSFDITYPGTGDYYIKFAVMSRGGNLQIDQMTWTPSGGDNPEPTEADRVEPSGVSMTDGAMAISFTGDASFAYHLLATDSLSPTNWYDFGGTNVGTGSLQSFAIPIDAEHPQRFFKIEVIRKP